MAFIEHKARELSRPTLEAVARALSRLNISPDWVSNVGLLLTAGVGVLAALGYLRWAGVAYVVASVTDALDGSLARVTGKGSRFGAFLDSTLDRFEESIVFLGLAVHYARVGGQWEMPLILLATVGSLMVSYTRARAEGVGVACREGMLTRPMRVAIMVAGLLLNQVLAVVIILAVGSLLTTFQRIYLVWRSTGGEAGGWAPPREPFITPGTQPLDIPQRTNGSAAVAGEKAADEIGDGHGGDLP